jgi:hypothetical protein
MVRQGRIHRRSTCLRKGMDPLGQLRQ